MAPVLHQGARAGAESPAPSPKPARSRSPAGPRGRSASPGATTDDFRSFCTSEASACREPQESLSVPLLSPDPQEYQLYRYRWVVLFCIFLTNLANASLWLTYSPISDIVSDKYGVPESAVNVLSLCLSALYGPVVWSAAPLVRRSGLASSVRVAAGLTAAGAAIRVLGRGPSTFWLLVAGQCVSGVARPVISQLLGLTSLNWFPKEQRQMATAIAALGNPFGVALGFVLSPAITHKDPARIVRLNEVTAAGALLFFVIVAVAVRERPPTDPSVAARDARKGRLVAESFREEFRRLHQFQYWYLAALFGLAFGQCNAVAVLLNQMLKPFGYEHSAVGLTGVMTIIPGVIGALCVSRFLGGRIKASTALVELGEEPQFRFLYRETLILIYILGGSFMTGIVWLAERSGLPQYNPYLLVSAALFGFFAQPAFAVALEAASECVYPASPSTAGAGVIMCAQYVGLAVSACCGYYMDQAPEHLKRDRVHEVGMGMSVCWIIAGVLMFGFKGKANLKRLVHEHSEESRTRDQYSAPRPSPTPTKAACAINGDDEILP